MIKPVFTAASEKKQYPLLCCGKRILARKLIDDARHYDSVGWRLLYDSASIEEFSTGICGVVNTMFTDEDFKPITSLSSHLLIEEIEDVLEHFTSLAAGKSLHDRENLFAAFLEQIRRSHTIVVADAFISDKTITLLKKYTKLPVYQCSGIDNQHVYPVVNLYQTEGLLLAKLVNDLKTGKRVLVFTDCARNTEDSKFQKLFNDLKKHARSSLSIDADSIKEIDINKVFETGYQFVLISPVITSGVSLEQDLFDKVYILGKQTIHPLQVLQTMFRYRRATHIELHISNKKPIKIDKDNLADEVDSIKMNDLLHNEEYKRLGASQTVRNRPADASGIVH